MKFENITKIILFGGGRVLAEFAKWIIKEKYEVLVFSSKGT